MMLRSRKNSDTGALQESQGPTKRHAPPVKDEPKRKRGGLNDLSNVMSNALCIDSTKKAGKVVPKVGLRHREVNIAGLKLALQDKKLGLKDSNGKQIVNKDRLSPVPETVKENEAIQKLATAESLYEEIDPCPGYDFDKENEEDLFMVTEYSCGIFKYYQAREKFFKIGDYSGRLHGFPKNWRGIVVDWLVEMQENFELTHETFYTAVKILDHFLDKTEKRVQEDGLQLLGSTAVFIASKFEERCPPAVDDFIWTCDKAFSSYDLLCMERVMLDTVGYDLGFPLAYRFLRRYAKVLYLDMMTLTLARFYLETCTLYYEFVGVRDSLMAAACLLLALRVKGLGDWNDKLIKYAGYHLSDVEPLMWIVNHAVLMRPKTFPRAVVIHNKYSSEIFGSVARYPLLPNRFKPGDLVQLSTELSSAGY